MRSLFWSFLLIQHLLIFSIITGTMAITENYPSYNTLESILKHLNRRILLDKQPYRSFTGNLRLFAIIVILSTQLRIWLRILWSCEIVWLKCHIEWRLYIYSTWHCVNQCISWYIRCLFWIHTHEWKRRLCFCFDRDATSTSFKTKATGCIFWIS